MLLKNLFKDIWNYSRILFVFVIFIIAVHFYCNLQFARLARLVDHNREINRPFAFEAFPIVVYNMYSGKISDWGKYSYLKIEADGEELKTTDLSISQEDQFVNPTQKFLFYKNQNFEDKNLWLYLVYNLHSSYYTSKIYSKVSNIAFLNDEQKWQNWMKRYLTQTLKREVHNVKISECFFTYSNVGKPLFVEQVPLYQF